MQKLSCRLIMFGLALLASGRGLGAQDAFEVPALANGSVRIVLRPGDLLQLGRLDGCDLPASQSEAQVDAIWPDSVLLRTSVGLVRLTAGEGDALVTGYRPLTATRPSKAAADLVFTLAVGAGGVLLGGLAGDASHFLTLGLFPRTPLVVTGMLFGGFVGLGVGASLRREDSDARARLENSWSQLELRRNVRAATCEFRPAP